MTPADPAQHYGVLAEFDTPGRILRAARIVREEGYTRWDCFTPFPVHGLGRAMGLRDTRLPWAVLAAGVTGTCVALALQNWMHVADYPLNVSGKPLFSLPAQIPIAFELTILFSALAAFVGMFAWNRLPRLHHPLFSSERFRRATTDRFFLVIEASDPAFDVVRTAELLRRAGGSAVEIVEDR
jgi:hypothetical protein